MPETIPHRRSEAPLVELRQRVRMLWFLIDCEITEPSGPWPGPNIAIEREYRNIKKMMDEWRKSLPVEDRDALYQYIARQKAERVW